MALVGCAGPNRELPPQATSQLVEMRDQLTQGKAAIQTVNDAASDLSERPRSDLMPQVNRLSSELESLQAVAAKSRTENLAADAQAQAYFSKWQEQIKTMSGDVAESASKRESQARASYGRLTMKIDELRPIYRSYVDNLTQAEQYLKTDTTAPGLDVVQPKLEEAIKHEPTLLRKIDETISEIDRIRAGK
jgi:predicted  nucleic acid-binding Zn-ribbon protein